MSIPVVRAAINTMLYILHLLEATLDPVNQDNFSPLREFEEDGQNMCHLGQRRQGETFASSRRSTSRKDRRIKEFGYADIAGL
jgi:hypothetical protein